MMPGLAELSHKLDQFLGGRSWREDLRGRPGFGVEFGRGVTICNGASHRQLQLGGSASASCRAAKERIASVSHCHVGSAACDPRPIPSSQAMPIAKSVILAPSRMALRRRIPRGTRRGSCPCQTATAAGRSRRRSGGWAQADRCRSPANCGTVPGSRPSEAMPCRRSSSS
jgi:hypothetical protein